MSPIFFKMLPIEVIALCRSTKHAVFNLSTCTPLPPELWAMVISRLYRYAFHVVEVECECWR